MNRPPTLAVVAFGTCLLGLATTGAADSNYVPDQVILKFRDGTTPIEQAEVLAELLSTDLEHFERIDAHLATISAMPVPQAVTNYSNHPAVEFIEPNYIVSVFGIPNDPLFDQLWGMHNTGQTGGTPGADISATIAWDIVTGTPDVVIGVIDTGVNYLHPDLADNIYTNPGEIPGNGVDDDDNGFVDDVRGWDFLHEDNDPMDDHFHGSHVSGTIGAVGNNGLGVVGVNWSVRIMPLKFLDAGGFGTTGDAIQCIEYATMMGVHLTSNSWGGGSFSSAMEMAIEDAGAAGILFIAAAGNDGANNDVFPHYPSSHTAENIIAVANTDHNDQLWPSSNYGLTSVDLGAPGVNVLSTVLGTGFGQATGTSMSTRFWRGRRREHSLPREWRLSIPDLSCVTGPGRPTKHR
jgi:subtilisin family serine protease